MQNKAQSGTNAAILVAIIAGLIIIYIIFLPTAERQRFLGNGTEPGGTGSAGSANVLLKEFPGFLSASSGLEDMKSIPDVFLVETTTAKELQSINPFIVRNGWFDKRPFKFDFEVQDTDNTDNVMLSFTAKKRLGILVIKLNDVIIFENELAKEIIEPVKLDKRLLGKTNKLEFSVSSVGMRFWTTNEYSLDNVKITGDITDTSRQESANVFSISESEFAGIDKATLRFTPYCGNVRELGILEVYINNKKLFSTVPNCDNQYKQSIPKSVLNEGENNIVFKTTKGSYSVEQNKIALEYREPRVKTYYFEVDSGTMRKIRNLNNNAVLTINFADDTRQKRARLNINGHIETLDTDRSIISKNINNRVLEGNNFIRLEPIDDLEVAEIKVELT